MVIVETEGGEAQPAAALGACEHQSLRLKTLTASRGGVGGGRREDTADSKPPLQRRPSEARQLCLKSHTVLPTVTHTVIRFTF